MIEFLERRSELLNVKGYLAIESLGTTALLLSYAFRCSGVARGCGLHWAALAWAALYGQKLYL